MLPPFREITNMYESKEKQEIFFFSCEIYTKITVINLINNELIWSLLCDFSLERERVFLCKYLCFGVFWCVIIDNFCNNIHFGTQQIESFGLTLQNRKLICVIGTIQSYLGFWGERLNFGITVAKIQPKVWGRIRKRWREKMLNFGNGDTKFPLPSSAAHAWSARS